MTSRGQAEATVGLLHECYVAAGTQDCVCLETGVWVRMERPL
jgi:hypothetical protein